MAIALPKYVAPVVIDSTNNASRLWDSDGAWVSGSLTAATYYPDNASSDLFERYMEHAFVNVGAEDSWTSQLSSDNKVQITDEDAAWKIDWDYSAATRAMATLLGIASSSYATWLTGTTAGAFLTADYQHQNAWYGTQGVVSEPIDDHREAAVSQVRAASGRIYTVHEESYDVRDIEHDYEPAHKIYPTTGYTNQDWTQSFWPTINAGQRIRYYPDATLLIYFDCVADVDTCRVAEASRYAPGVEIYAVTTRLLGYV